MDILSRQQVVFPILLVRLGDGKHDHLIIIDNKYLHICNMKGTAACGSYCTNDSTGCC